MAPGVRATQPLYSFLTGLTECLEHQGEPDRVTDQRLRESTIGGFAAEIAGRHARIAAAETVLGTARAALDAAQRRESARKTELTEAQAQVHAAEGTHELAAIESQQRTLAELLKAVDEALGDLGPQLKRARDDLIQVLADKG
jgi:chromosome segregation ATPase